MKFNTTPSFRAQPAIEVEMTLRINGKEIHGHGSKVRGLTDYGFDFKNEVNKREVKKRGWGKHNKKEVTGFDFLAFTQLHNNPPPPDIIEERARRYERG